MFAKTPAKMINCSVKSLDLLAEFSTTELELTEALTD